MPYEQKPNSGTLFKNDKKTATNHPDYQGTWKDANGKEWSFAAWIKEGKSGKFMGLAVSPKDGQPPVGKPVVADLKDDDIPF